MFQKENEYKILKIFFDNPNKEFYIREISKLTNVPLSVTFKILNKFKEKNFIEKNKKKVTTNFKLKDNNEVKRTKRLYNIYEIYKSKLVDFLIESYNNPEAIILFGSYALGENIERGDIDIAIITKKHKEINLSKFEKELNKNIHLLEIDLNKASKEFKNNLANGFVLDGYLNLQ